MKRRVQIACAVFLLVLFALPVVSSIRSRPQLVAFATGVAVVSILFFLGKRWLERRG